MRILTIIDSLAVGGAEQSLAAVTPHLLSRGVDAHIAFLVDRSGIGPQLEEAGAVVHSLAGDGGRLAALRRTRRLLRKIRPDLVHTTLFEADLIGRTAAWTCRIPVVSSLVTEAYGPEHVGNPEYRVWKVRAAHAVDAATARMVRRFHAVSTTTADVMAQRLRVPRDRIDVIARGRDTSQLGIRSGERRMRVREDLGIAAETPVVLAAARHFHFKGLDVLARAFPAVVAEFPDARLLLAGRHGPATEEIEQLVAAGNVAEASTLLGYRRDVPDLMSAADVFVLPSRVEGSPGALIEAMAIGVPTVASNIGPVRELVGTNNDQALLVDAGDSIELAKSIAALLRDRTQAETLAKAAQARFAECCSMEVIADATLRLYERAISG